MSIEIIRALEDAPKAKGLAIVIDVFRAFTTAAYIFANNASKIIPVKDLEDAYALKTANPEYILVGERKGIKPENFDFGNSPSEVTHKDFSGKIIILTTSRGTKGLVSASNARDILVASFVVADGIIKYIKDNDIKEISLIATAPDAESDNEDILLAYYIRDVLTNSVVNESEIKNKLRMTSVAQFLLHEAGVPQVDIDLCLNFHQFGFIMKQVTEDNRLVLIRENV